MESFEDADLYGDLYDTVDVDAPTPAVAEAAPAAQDSSTHTTGGQSPAVVPGLPAAPAPLHFDPGFAAGQRAKQERDRAADTADEGLVETD